MPGKIKPQKIRIKRIVKGSVKTNRPMSGAEYDRSRSGANTLGPNFADKRRATGGKVYDPRKVNLFNMSGFVGEYKTLYGKKQEAKTGRRKV